MVNFLSWIRRKSGNEERRVFLKQQQTITWLSRTRFKSSDETLLCSETRVVDGSAVKAFDAFSCRPSVDARLEGNARTDWRHKIRGTSENKTHNENNTAHLSNSRILFLFFTDFFSCSCFFLFSSYSATSAATKKINFNCGTLYREPPEEMAHLGWWRLPGGWGGRGGSRLGACT